ncbi:tatC: twin arginine-targeting protein translocase TatC [Rubrobacter radiotolerans]|uniref:Sec-independent protein translocase protein TatC n=1 Tax=Rubrobacter radiotolerans TaxID=42256 RepID=A0A023X4W5_RUBRA|nr:twin-arginine translocase subunit TatC [Rubrobacter radiotolerans]AHY47030.1 tatC: twin arginine-targeting protein translocase TatC [Rubrobacter radiotolerans]MDX5894436.1 twin-arginine translocase subunit TatC [Rubrobacter radiotolerans]SMC05999.1 sec-independent protein translocase protein TatC [Rubrobacter radiotolerans DSM 5868]
MASSPLKAFLRPSDEANMTLVEHLDELRSRIIKVALVFVVGAIFGWIFKAYVFDFLMAPAPETMDETLQFTSVTDPIFTDLKLALYTGLMITLPVLFYQAWAFVAPAVGEMGRLFTYTLITLASLLFVGGVAFGYYLVLPIALNFLIGWDPSRFSEIITAEAYLRFITRFLLAFGVAFEVPAATFVGAKMGLVNAEFMRKYRRHAIMVNAVIAAFITPADPFSMIMLAVPLVLLYEVSIFIAARVNPAVEETLQEALDDEGEELEDEYEEDYDRTGGR